MSETPPRSLNPWTIWVPIILIALGGVFLYNYLLNQQEKERKLDKDRPPILTRLETDLTLTERNGKTVHLADLRGKILVASWVYTRCPRGCAGVVAKLKKLYEEYGSNPNIQFVSFTLDPEDTPEMMNKFASGIGIKPEDNWWFVNGTKEEVRHFMTKYLQFRPVQDLPEADRLSPDDKYIHDLRVALVDHNGYLRSLCDIMNADAEFQTFWDARIRSDLNYLVRDQAKKN